MADDPARIAWQAREALRDLAHATQTMNDPAQAYDVLGALTAGLASLGQVLDQLADTHGCNAAPATTTDGDRDSGRHQALIAAGVLRNTAGELASAARSVDAAWTRTGNLTWSGPPAPAPPAPDRTVVARPRRPDGLGR